MSISHAYVYFKSGVKQFVPISCVLNFNPKSENDFDNKKKYKVWTGNGKGKGDLLNAFIILLGSKYCFKIFFSYFQHPEVPNSLDLIFKVVKVTSNKTFILLFIQV